VLQSAFAMLENIFSAMPVPGLFVPHSFLVSATSMATAWSPISNHLVQGWPGFQEKSGLQENNGSGRQQRGGNVAR